MVSTLRFQSILIDNKKIVQSAKILLVPPKYVVIFGAVSICSFFQYCDSNIELSFFSFFPHLVFDLSPPYFFIFLPIVIAIVVDLSLLSEVSSLLLSREREKKAAKQKRSHRPL